AMAVREAGLVDSIVGYSRPLAGAHDLLRQGVIDRAVPLLAGAVADADLIMVAVPVASMPEILRELATVARDGALIMDVSSTKRSVVQAALGVLGPRLPDFVPAHPIAGKER